MWIEKMPLEDMIEPQKQGYISLWSCHNI